MPVTPDTAAATPDERDTAPWKGDYRADELLDVACPVCGARRPTDIATEFGIAIARCGGCDVVYTRTPLPDSQGHYGPSREAVLAKYGPIFRGEAPHPRQANYDEHLEQLEGLVGAPGDLLDVGAHSGFFMRAARDRGWRVTGVEPSPVSAELAREQFGLDVRTGFLEDADLPDASFDVVTLTDVLEHVDAPRTLLREIQRVLRPGGRVFIKVPNARYVLAKHKLLGRARIGVDDVFDAREHLVYYTDATLRRLLHDVGLGVERLTVPSPIQTGGALRRALRTGGSRLAQSLPAGAALPMATDLVAVAGKPARIPGATGPQTGSDVRGSALEAEAVRSIAAAGGLVVDAGGAAPFTKGLGEFRELFAGVDYRTLDVAAETNPDIVGDIHDLPFADASVDAFICRSVLEHVRNPEQAVAEMARALKPGGQLLLTVPSTYPYHARPGAGGYPDLWRFFEDTLRMLLADFRTVQVARKGGPATAVVLFLPFLNRRAKRLRPLAERIDEAVERRRRHSNATFLVAWARR